MTLAWVVAGAPGAGKSTVAELLLRRLPGPAALLDKDTMYGGFVAATLASAGRPEGEREGPWYDEHIKLHEYAGMAATAAQIRAGGCPVVLVAPFTGQTRDPLRWKHFVAELGGDPVRLIWVGCDPVRLRERIVGRGSGRDGQKLDRFDDFVRATHPNVPPPVPHHWIDNSNDDVDRLIAQVNVAMTELTMMG